MMGNYFMELSCKRGIKFLFLLEFRENSEESLFTDGTKIDVWRMFVRKPAYTDKALKTSRKTLFTLRHRPLYRVYKPT